MIGFEIKVGARAGTMSICIPFNVIEPVIGKLAAQSWLVYSSGGNQTDKSRHVVKNIRRAELPLTAMLGETKITINELMDLAPGDIIQLDKLVGRDFILEVRGQKKFAGKLGKLRGNRALQITRTADPDEPL